MFYRDDWDKIRLRYEAFWQNEIADRCPVFAAAPKQPQAWYVYPDSPEERLLWWTDGEYILKKHLEVFSKNYFAGDSYPIIYLNLGASGHAGFYEGADYSLTADNPTVWFKPSLENLDGLKFDNNSLLYKKTLELARFFAAESRGRYVTSVPDIAGDMDALSLLRGSEQLLMDLFDEPEAVQIALLKIHEGWKRLTDEVMPILTPANDGGNAIGWLRVFAPGRHMQLQSDISVMISPGQFKEFVVSELERACSVLEYSLYHLDGIEQLRHLEHILSVPGLHTIQWTHVAGQPPPTAFLPQLKYMQQRGMRLALMLRPDEIEAVMTELSSKGLYIYAFVNSPEEADYAVKLVERYTHD
jgi:hypothetical protein